MEAYPAVDLVLQEVGQAFQVQFVKSATHGGQGFPNESSKSPEVTPEVRLLNAIAGEMSRKDEEHFRTAYLLPSIEAGLIEMTVPEKPRSSKQRYRLTEKGREYLRSAEE